MRGQRPGAGSRELRSRERRDRDVPVSSATQIASGTAEVDVKPGNEHLHGRPPLRQSRRGDPDD
jgi:hypothetical protein